MERWAGRKALVAFSTFVVTLVTQLGKRYKMRRVKTKAPREERLKWYKDKMRKKQKDRRQRRRMERRQEWSAVLREDPEEFERLKLEAIAQRKEELAAKKIEKVARKERLKKAIDEGPLLVIDMHARETTEKERSKCVRQLGFMHAFNRKLPAPWAMVLASCDDSYDTALTKHEAEKWPGVVRFPEAIPEACKAWERLSMDRLVYLSPDSPNVLEEVKDDEAYILGAIIDISVEKYASLKRAESMGIRHARLPLKEYGPPGLFKVLNLNHVFELLQRYKECKDWSKAIVEVLPDRNTRRLPGESARSKRKQRAKEKKAQAGGSAMASPSPQ